MLIFLSFSQVAECERGNGKFTGKPGGERESDGVPMRWAQEGSQPMAAQGSSPPSRVRSSDIFKSFGIVKGRRVEDSRGFRER